MELFEPDPTQNLLPYDGEVHYFGQLLPYNLSNHYYECLWNEIAWKNDEAYIFGKHIITKRKVAWYGDEAYDYSYSGVKRQALKWSPKLLELKSICEKYTQSSFNSCLLNLYHDGSEGMAWHSDDEETLKKMGVIASMTFGAERKFAFKHKKTKESVSLLLQSGSLLTMKGTTQQYWLHRLPPTKKALKPRINLTFRTILTNR